MLVWQLIKMDVEVLRKTWRAKKIGGKDDYLAAKQKKR
jgi:hypothetical protein